MKTIEKTLIIAAVTFSLCGCSDLFKKENQGEISIDFEKSFFKGTRASNGIPNEDDFIITVTDAKGNEIYSGKYRVSPETIKVEAGSYTVSAVSRNFDEPLFDAPQFGDSQIITVASNQNVSVLLNCKQMNCGVKINLDSYFRTAFPEGILYLSGSSGTLMYGYSENRTAYFKPGGLTLYLVNEKNEHTICTRTLEAEQMLSLNLSANIDNSSSSGGVSLKIDTTRNWSSETLVVGEDNSGNSDNAYNVVQARERIGDNDIWVYGYIVGVATNTNKFSFSSPFTKNTNIIIGLRSTSTESQYLMSVELPKGDIRDELNLQHNPEKQGAKIYLKGEITSAYYGIPGIKDVSTYKLD